MYILAKERDFYDHYSYVYGEDKSIILDRRKSKVITNNDLLSVLQNYRYHKNQIDYILLEVGTVQYLIKLFNYVVTDFNELGVDSFEVELVKEFREYKHCFNSIITVIGINTLYSLFSRWQHKELKPDVTLSELLDSTTRKAIKLPVLRDTILTSILDGDSIWKELQNYLSSLNNDKESNDLSDIEKVETHGFDKKKSFRNMK